MMRDIFQANGILPEDKERLKISARIGETEREVPFSIASAMPSTPAAEEESWREISS